MLSKNKFHTPEGTADALPCEARMTRNLQHVFLDCFSSFGYKTVTLPAFEYIDVFTDDFGHANQKTMIKFFDRHGNILSMRPDFTPSIARLAATKYSDKTPLKFCYTGRAFIDDEAYSNVRQKEFIQSGVEFLGTESIEADAEIIALTIEALKKSGLDEFQIEIGHAGFFKGLVSQANLSENQIEELRLLTNRKDFVNIEKFLEDNKITGYTAELIKKLPQMFGDITTVKDINTDGLNDTSKEAIKNLCDIYDVLCDYDMSEYISFDMGLVQSLNYYTGMVFKGFTHNVGFPICGGGRYDTLVSRFGRTMPATGVALWVDRIYAALIRNGVEPEIVSPDILAVYKKEGRKTAIENIKNLRNDGFNVEIYYERYNLDEIKKYAQDNNINKVYLADEDKYIDVE